MKFKDVSLEDQYIRRPAELLQICDDFNALSEFFNIEPVVTRVLEKIDGSSGVHEAGRAVDFRDEHLDKYTYTDAQATLIAAMLNLKYARHDGKKTALFHVFDGGPRHCHIQLAPSLDKYIKQDVFK